ncbi:MAG TPA: redox-regulated ATPase YchF [Kofleriaceae bacterium]|jgi:GTP-binding protein YchF|nr:redox-regulated ATPase YchF [Kofleriaceae bacterium]
MKIGLVGFPGSGKSTVFNALTGLQVETGYGAKSGKPALGTVKVPDARVDALSQVFTPKKTTYAEIVFTDVGGGGSARGLDRAVLNSMREVDALCQVVRAFPDAAGEAPRPLGEIADLEAETILADLEVTERRVERLTKERSNPRELELMTRIQAHLEAEKPLRSLELAAEEQKMISQYRFLSAKPLLLVLNVGEGEVAKPAPADVAKAATERGLGLVVLSAQIEQDIAQMPAEEQGEFLGSLGLSEPARNRFIKAAFALIDLISMLTAGPDECRAWPITRGTPAPRAAGKIHSDIERGFIRAEVMKWEDLVALGSEAKCREVGKLRTEGKDYIMQDGDVVNFRFNV